MTVEYLHAPSIPDLRRATGAISPCSDKVRLLDKDNNLISGYVPWTEALAPQAYMVNLFCEDGCHTVVLDFDAKPESPGTAERADRESLRAVELLEGCGLTAVRCSSGPTGGRHVYVPVRGIQPTRAGAAAHLSFFHARALVDGFGRLGLKTLDPNPMSNRAGSIRPPLAMHKTGLGHSQFLDTDVDTALARLEGGNDPQRVVALAQEFRRLHKQWPLVAPDRSEAPPATRGTSARTDDSGSADVQAIIVQHVNTGASASACRATLLKLPTDSPAGASVAKRLHAGTFEAWFQRSWKNGAAFVRDNPARRLENGDDHQVILGWQGQLPAHEAALKDGERRVARFLRDLATHHGRAMVGASTRTAAAAVGIDQSTAARAFPSLAKQGYIELAGTVDSGNGHRYRLLSPDRWTTCARASVGSTPTYGGVSRQTDAGTHAAVALALDLQADLWRRDGLGESARFVYEHLAVGAVGAGSGTVSVGSLAAALGTTEGAVRRHLSKLVKHRLARRLGRGEWVVEVRPAEEVAAELDVLGRNERDRQRMEDEQVADRIRLLLRRLGKPADATVSRRGSTAAEVADAA